jgi:16S rRNA (uracil1498-N3)-methyltransferase
MSDYHHPVTHYYLDAAAVAGDSCVLDASESRHLVKVMRAEPGYHFQATDGRGNLYEVELLDGGTEHARGRIVNRNQNVNELPIELTTAFGLLTGARTEQVIDQCTQLGVTRIQPLLSKRLTVSWRPEREATKRDRWRRVAMAAMKQSCRCRLPDTLSPIRIAELGETFSTYDLVLFGTVGGEPISTLAPLRAGQRVTVITGPEEGFAGDEELLLSRAGAVPITLGAQRLRAELAPVVMVSQLLSRLD